MGCGDMFALLAVYSVVTISYLHWLFCVFVPSEKVDNQFHEMLLLGNSYYYVYTGWNVAINVDFVREKGSIKLQRLHIFIILNLNHIDSRYVFLKLSDPQLQKVDKCQQKLFFFFNG